MPAPISFWGFEIYAQRPRFERSARTHSATAREASSATQHSSAITDTKGQSRVRAGRLAAAIGSPERRARRSDTRDPHACRIGASHRIAPRHRRLGFQSRYRPQLDRPVVGESDGDHRRRRQAASLPLRNQPRPQGRQGLRRDRQPGGGVGQLGRQVGHDPNHVRAALHARRDAGERRARAGRHLARPAR